MKYANSANDLENVDRAIVSAFESVKEFAGSDFGKELTPKQLLAAMTIAAVEQATREGLSGSSAAATLRDIANGIEAL